MWYTGRLTRRIINLSKEAAAVTAGDLERSITAPGNDELSALADSVDEMRRSVIERMGNEKRAWEANTELITAISHDIRTPMTAMLGYLGLLVGGTEAEATKAQLASSAYVKAMELKRPDRPAFPLFPGIRKAELEDGEGGPMTRGFFSSRCWEMEFDPAGRGLYHAPQQL